MNKTEFVAAIAEKAGLSKKDADKAVSALIETVQKRQSPFLQLRFRLSRLARASKQQFLSNHLKAAFKAAFSFGENL